MARQTIVVTYETLDIAENARKELFENQIKHEHVGVAVNDNTGEALVAVTVTDIERAPVTKILERHDTQEFDVRETGWRKGNNLNELHPDAANFTAVERSDTA